MSNETLYGDYVAKCWQKECIEMVFTFSSLKLRHFFSFIRKSQRYVTYLREGVDFKKKNQIIQHQRNRRSFKATWWPREFLLCEYIISPVSKSWDFILRSYDGSAGTERDSFVLDAVDQPLLPSVCRMHRSLISTSIRVENATWRTRILVFYFLLFLIDSMWSCFLFFSCEVVYYWLRICGTIIHLLWEF